MFLRLRESPVSDDTATEWHVDAKRDEEDLPNTKDLPNRGMEHVDKENVRWKDLHTSTEASVTGTSTECADGTLVLLKGAPHEMRNEPQNSLRATPRRLPIEGEPCECEQEVANGVVTARCTKGMAQSANPPETDVDVDRTPTLDGELAMRDCGVDEGNGMEHKDLRLLKAELYCEERCQCNRNAEEDIPSAQRLLLEGEWAGCASGESNNSKGCSRSREVEPADTSNESETLVTLSIESEDPHSGETLRMYLGGMWMRADDANGLGCRTDGPRSQADGPVSRTKHIWYSEHGMHCRFESILERAMSVTHVAVILRTRTSPAYEEEFMKMDYPDARNEYGTS